MSEIMIRENYNKNSENIDFEVIQAFVYQEFSCCERTINECTNKISDELKKQIEYKGIDENNITTLMITGEMNLKYTRFETELEYKKRINHIARMNNVSVLKWCLIEKVKKHQEEIRKLNLEIKDMLR